jgi:predicted DNA-binding protein
LSTSERLRQVAHDLGTTPSAIARDAIEKHLRDLDRNA